MNRASSKRERGCLFQEIDNDATTKKNPKIKKKRKKSTTDLPQIDINISIDTISVIYLLSPFPTYTHPISEAAPNKQNKAKKKKKKGNSERHCDAKNELFGIVSGTRGTRM